MRGLTNIFLFLAACLTVVGVFVLRQQTFGGFQRQIGSMLGQGTKVAKTSPVPAAPPPHAARVRSANQRPTPKVEILTEIIPITPKPPVETIQVGMQKKNLGDFGRPDVMTSARQGDQFFETYIYLASPPGKARVVRLVNGRVAWVGSTETILPPLLVPQTKEPRARVFLASDPS
jgi:hypothetical protein